MAPNNFLLGVKISRNRPVDISKMRQGVKCIFEFGRKGSGGVSDAILSKVSFEANECSLTECLILNFICMSSFLRTVRSVMCFRNLCLVLVWRCVMIGSIRWGRVKTSSRLSHKIMTLIFVKIELKLLVINLTNVSVDCVGTGLCGRGLREGSTPT